MFARFWSSFFGKKVGLLLYVEKESVLGGAFCFQDASSCQSGLSEFSTWFRGVFVRERGRHISYPQEATLMLQCFLQRVKGYLMELVEVYEFAVEASALACECFGVAVPDFVLVAAAAF